MYTFVVILNVIGNNKAQSWGKYLLPNYYLSTMKVVSRLNATNINLWTDNY